MTDETERDVEQSADPGTDHDSGSTAGTESEHDIAQSADAEEEVVAEHEEVRETPPEGGSPTARRFQNPLYRVMTMAGAGLVLVLGLAGALVSRTLSPPVPMVWTVIDLIVTVVLFLWYVLGMRCYLDLDDEHVTVSKKTVTKALDRADVESIDLDTSWWGAIQPSGRPVILNMVDGRKVRSYGALPSDAIGQANAFAELQKELGDSADIASGRMQQRIAEKFVSD